KILELLNKSNETILDITHGFRHQPIMAIFASTLSQFLDRKDLKIIYAKEKERFKSYEYIYLNEYIEITQISLLLTGFIRTLNFIPVQNMKLLNNQVFEDFSKSLLSNDIKGVERNYTLLKNELVELQQNEELKHISNLITKVKNELKPMEMLPYFEPYQKYIVLSKMTVEKNYLIVALAYIFESVREYCSYRFEPICKEIEFKDSYQRNDNVMKTIGNFRLDNKILRRYSNLYQVNKAEFKKVNRLYNRLRKRRNALAHINQTKNFNTIKEDLKKIITEVEELFNSAVLSNIRR
ncbi:MAG TPA: CRISPR-associated DxTHG motif protein, partial [Campylobacterales bacterium]|nr:CRISPR-associated DxTHG motif protein [Campylobacterales bacterium]